MKSNKIIIYSLLILVILQLWILHVIVSGKNATIAELNQENKDAKVALQYNKELRDLTDQLVAKNEEFRKANEDLAVLCKKYCPTGIMNK